MDGKRFESTAMTTIVALRLLLLSALSAKLGSTSKSLRLAALCNELEASQDLMHLTSETCNVYMTISTNKHASAARY